MNTQNSKNQSSLTNSLTVYNIPKLSALGWDATKLNDEFINFILEEGIYKKQFENKLSNIVKEVYNKDTHDIEYDYKKWDELLINWFMDEGERVTIFKFEGYLFEQYAIDNGYPLIPFKQDDIWITCVYDFFFYSLRHVQVQ